MAFATSGVITDRGRNLLAKAQAGAALQILRIELGEGSIGTGSQTALTALKAKVMDAPISAFEPVKNGTVKVSAQLNPQSIPKDFWWREVGVIAQDPDLGPILYAYCAAGDKADYIVKSGVDAMTVIVPLVVGSAANVTVALDLSLSYVTTGDFTPGNLLEMIKTVDGHNSGLVADTVDGLHGADLAKAQDLVGLAKTTDLAPYAKTADLAPYAKTTDLLPYAKTTDLAPYAMTTALTALGTALDNQVKTHTHNGADAPKVAYSNITGVPASLPANGGNAATVGGLGPADLVKVADYTAAKVLEMLKTVDGAASGLVADYIHGQPGSELLNLGRTKRTIPPGSDLNNYQLAGSYIGVDDTAVKTMGNRACDESFHLVVDNVLNDINYVVQTATTYTGRIFVRRGHAFDGWQPWREVMMQ